MFRAVAIFLELKNIFLETFHSFDSRDSAHIFPNFLSNVSKYSNFNLQFLSPNNKNHCSRTLYINPRNEWNKILHNLFCFKPKNLSDLFICPDIDMHVMIVQCKVQVSRARLSLTHHMMHNAHEYPTRHVCSHLF